MSNPNTQMKIEVTEPELNFNCDYTDLVSLAIKQGTSGADCVVTCTWGGRQLDVDDFTQEVTEELNGVICAYRKEDGTVIIELDSMDSPCFDYPGDPEIWVELIKEVS